MKLTKKSRDLVRTYLSLNEYFQPLGGLSVDVYGFTKERKTNLTIITKSHFEKRGIDIFEYKNGTAPTTILWRNGHIQIKTEVEERKEGLYLSLNLESSDNKREFDEINISEIEKKVREFYPESKIQEEVEEIEKMLKKARSRR